MSLDAGTSPSYVRRFAEPDDVLELEGMVSRIVSLRGMGIAHTVHMPGWRWSTHVRPIVRTELCETHHVGYCLEGRARILLRSGESFDIGRGDLFDVPAGHEAWVVDDDPWESVEWIGVRSWIPNLDDLGERVLATIVFTDIVGSTAIADRLGDVAWAELIATHEERVRDTITEFRGREVKPTGDGVLAVFDSPVRAVRCAVALREVASGLGLEIRAAIHTGEVEIADSDLRGVAIHEASRIMALAGPTQVWVSATTRSLLGEARFEFEDVGEHLLRGLPEPRRLYRLI